MKDNKTDYNKPRTDLNKLLPEVNLDGAEILKGFNDNIFGRFFTKDEIDRIVGYIGTDPQNTSDKNQIIEPSEYRQANQLQPIIYSKVGDIDWFMSFRDFMTRLERLGVNIDRFNEWGASLQFNWVPPIDIDKLINYGDYFWDSDSFNDPPQYVTIKNQENWVNSRLQQSYRSIANGLPTYIIDSYDTGADSITVLSDVSSQITSGIPVILSGNSQDAVFFTPTSVVYDGGGNETVITFDNAEYDITTGVNDVYTNINATQFIITGTETGTRSIFVGDNLTSLFTKSYIFSSEDSPNQPTTLWKVESSEYNNLTNETKITVTEDISGFDWLKVSVKPILRSLQSEVQAISSAPLTSAPYGALTESEMGDIIWTRNTLLYTGTTGGGEGTELGSEVLTDTASGVDFLDGTYLVGDTIRISGTSFDGDYIIENLITSTQVGLSTKFFTDVAIEYEIVRKTSITELESDIAPLLPTTNQVWFDTPNDQLRQWDGADWNVIYDNYSYLVDLTNSSHLINLSQNNPWTTSNKWIHRSNINNFTGKSRAQNPIIEFFPYIELSEFSYSEKVWNYRRTEDITYTESSISPTLFELVDTTKTTSGIEVLFIDDNTIIFGPEFGNMTEGLKSGTEIKLVGFNSNNGEYIVDSSEFVQFIPNSRYQTKITLRSDVVDPLDVPDGAYVAPKFTSTGDLWIDHNTNHWQFNRIENISASSLQPERNPMLDFYVTDYNDGSYESQIGLYFQEYKLLTGEATQTGGVIFTLNSSLHDLALIEDYQEGDVRVYINGVRQYGNYTDIRSASNLNYVGGIKFSSNVSITDNDIVRIEVGEYALEDVGRGSISIPTTTGIELFNLTNNFRLEQDKTERTQYPWFSIYDVNGNRLQIASNVFKYKDVSTGTYFPELDQRIDFNPVSQDYIFDQKLLEPSTGELYLYFDGGEYQDELQSIWKRGINNEQYVPVEKNGFWEIPNQWYFNIKHENRESVSLTETFQHFSSITNSQTVPGIDGTIFNNSYFLDGSPNYGLGGRIKEHNNGFDILASSMFINNVNPLDLIDFARSQYNSAQNNILSIIEDRFVELLTAPLDSNDLGIVNVSQLTDFISYTTKDDYDKNDRLDQWFGDSSTFNPVTNVGVKNWIATAPFFGLQSKTFPYITNDNNGFIQLVHHDGHRKIISVTPAIKSILFQELLKNNPDSTDVQTVTSESDPFPVTIKLSPVESGDYIIRTNSTLKTRNLYRYSNIDTWELVDLNLIYAKSLLNIELSLYNVLSDELLSENFTSVFDFRQTRSDIEYRTKSQERFSNYISENNIQAPFLNNGYVQNNPFTWNYAYTPIPTDPRNGELNPNVFASWQALYETIYRTPYPHLEPWKLQQFNDKPDWWDNEYLSGTTTRIWKSTMWSNIIDGKIPVGEIDPYGNIGTGLSNQIADRFTYIPVNSSNTPTLDGYGPDEILPPYWNSNNSPINSVRSLYDSALQEFITTPSADYQFGQLSPTEWEWKSSIYNIYDEFNIAFKLSPLKFTNQTFGLELIDVACLQVDSRVNKVSRHDETILHGDLGSDSTINRVNGFNQWYIHFNRYNGFDGASSEFREMWSGWTNPLTYQFGAFIDTETFDVDSEFFDVVNRDYDVLFKKSSGIRDIWLDSLTATITSSPSKFATEFDSSNDWTVEFNSTSPISRPIEYFGTQSYPVRVTAGDDTIKVFSFRISSAEVNESFGFDTIQYAETASSSTPTTLLNDNTAYSASVFFDNTTVVNLSIIGKNAQTFGELVSVIDTQLGSNGSAFLEDGNLVISSDTLGGNTKAVVTDLGLFITASPNFLGTTGNKFNLVSFDKVFYIDGDLSKYFPDGSLFTVSDSTNFNGTYTVSSAFYNVSTKETRIEIRETVEITESTVDGFIEPSTGVDLPEEWITGTGVNWVDGGSLPAEFNDINLYYIIRVDDRSFKLSPTRESAIAGINFITPTTTGSTQNYIGRIKNTFTAFSGRNVQAYWKQHYVDNRSTFTNPAPISISGIQNIIDFINGYSVYLESIGFVYEDEDGTNRDSSTGRTLDWLFETEKLIEFIYASRKNQQSTREEYPVTLNSGSNVFTSDRAITLSTGTKVNLIVNNNGTLPIEFDNPISDSIVYYIIQTATPGVYQLAGSSVQAKNGNALPFSDNGSGEIKLVEYIDTDRLPSLPLNPHKNQISIDHATGIISNMVAGTDLDLITDQRIYTAENKTLTVNDILVFRNDLKTTIGLTPTTKDSNSSNSSNVSEISGMHVFFDGYEHVIQFKNSSSNDVLIYDQFLGINTLRFSLELDRQVGFTLRPNVGGNVILDRSQNQNIESAIESIRFAYSTYRSREGDYITDKVRDSLGYDGPFDYADDIGITDKTQFIFYRGLIQTKGTNFAANAFANQSQYEGLDVDEFWAYRLDCFGDSKEKKYPEFRLKSNEVSRKDLRLEFVESLGTPSDNTFIGIDITDDTRWFEQPDQVEKLLPRDRLYTTVTVVEKIEDVVNSPQYFTIANITPEDDKYVELSSPADFAIITYLAASGTNFDQRAEFTEGVEFEFVTNTLIKFIGEKNPDTFTDITIYTLTYNYDAQNPANIINRKTNTVVTEVPFWNPSRGQYYSGAIYGVNFQKSTDPAIYTEWVESVPSTYTYTWNSNFKNNIWFDTNLEYYLPYDDSNITTNIDSRINNWGKLSNFGEVRVYQWTESDVLPSEYDDQSIQNNNDNSLLIDERKTGISRKVVYRNDGTSVSPIWVEERDEVFEFIAEIVETSGDNSLTGKGAPLTAVYVYVDGVGSNTDTFTFNDTTFKDLADYVSGDTGISPISPAPNQGKTIQVVSRATLPTPQQLTDVDYKIDTPFTAVNRIDPITGRSIPKYYFWVEDTLNPLPITGGSTSKTTAKNIKDGLVNIPTPYMIPNNIVDITTTSFSKLFTTNKPTKENTVSYEYPLVYNQLIIKSIGNNVPNEDFYTLRFTKDYTLRDRLLDTEDDVSDLERKNLHWEWKLFREKQFEKIDRNLWNAITESILGFEYDGTDIGANVAVSPTPTVTPTVTPTLTPYIPPSASPTPGVTPTPTPTGTAPVTPSPTASVTPTGTPAGTPAVTSTPAGTPAVTPTPTPTLTPNVTSTPASTPPATPPVTPAGSAPVTVTPTNTPVATAQPTPTPSPTDNTGVVLGDRAFINIDTAPDVSSQITIGFEPNGRLGYRIGQGTGLIYIPGTWWSTSPTTTSLGGFYDIRIDYLTGNPANQVFGPSPGIWTNLGTAKTFLWSQDVAGLYNASIQVQIRDSNTQIVKDSAVFSIQLQARTSFVDNGSGFGRIDDDR